MNNSSKIMGLVMSQKAENKLRNDVSTIAQSLRTIAQNLLRSAMDLPIVKLPSLRTFLDVLHDGALIAQNFTIGKSNLCTALSRMEQR